MNNLKNVFIAGGIIIAIETGLHSEKSSPHVHIEQINPITKWSTGWVIPNLRFHCWLQQYQSIVTIFCKLFCGVAEESFSLCIRV